MATETSTAVSSLKFQPSVFYRYICAPAELSYRIRRTGRKCFKFLFQWHFWRADCAKNAKFH